MRSRLFWSVSASLALHAAVLAIFWLRPLFYDVAPKHTAARTLLAHIRPAPTQSPSTAYSAPNSGDKTISARSQPAAATPVSQAPSTTAREEAGTTSAPRFVRAPEFASIANYPASLRFQMRLMLFVSDTGRVQRIDVMESGPIPSDLKDMIIAELYNARLIPAYKDGQAVNAKTEIILGASADDQ